MKKILCRLFKNGICSALICIGIIGVIVGICLKIQPIILFSGALISAGVLLDIKEKWEDLLTFFVY